MVIASAARQIRSTQIHPVPGGADDDLVDAHVRRLLGDPANGQGSKMDGACVGSILREPQKMSVIGIAHQRSFTEPITFRSLK
jgi:hypothetical protein